MSNTLTHIYLVRHAEPNYQNHDDFSRELTQKGLQDRQYLSHYFEKIHIDQIYSSPYKRAVDTIQLLADERKLPIHKVDNFRERKIDSVWIEDFQTFSEKQWADFSYKLADGESLQEVQDRTVKELSILLDKHVGNTLLIGGHGTAISTLLNHYQPTFSYTDFHSVKALFPFVAHLIFDQKKCLSLSIDNIFTGETYTYLSE